MATETTNYNLKKPALTDPVDVTVLNGNADIIDNTFKDHSDKLGNLLVLNTVDKTSLVNALNESLKNGRTSTVVIAPNDAPSSVKKNADYVCTGTDDQNLINSVIQGITSGNVFFASGGTFNLSAQINMKSNVNLESNGAIFKPINQVLSNCSQDAAAGQRQIKVNSVTGFVVGMMVEIKDSAHWESGTITAIDTTTNTLTMQINLANTYTLANGARVFSNFSYLVGNNVSNVIVKGITVDGNKVNNPQSDDTNFAQNGIQFNNSTLCSIVNCYVHDGNRHGILFESCTYSTVINCIVNGWGEHGIDIWDAQLPPRLSNISVIGCTCNGNSQNGIQLHRGSGISLIGNTCNNNVMNGICAGQEQAHDNMIIGNTCTNNSRMGIYMYFNCNNITISNNVCRDNNIDGIQIDTGNTRITITNNQVQSNKARGIRLYGGSQCIVSNNQLRNNNLNGELLAEISLESTSIQNLVQGNMLEKDSASSKTTYGVQELTSSANYNTILNNVSVGIATGISIAGANSVQSNNYSF